MVRLSRQASGRYVVRRRPFQGVDAARRGQVLDRGGDILCVFRDSR